MILDEMPDGVLEIRTRGGVEPGGRLVEDEQISPVRQRVTMPSLIVVPFDR